MRNSNNSDKNGRFLTTINYCRLSARIVQDERFSLSASHPLAIISLLYTFLERPEGWLSWMMLFGLGSVVFSSSKHSY